MTLTTILQEACDSGIADLSGEVPLLVTIAELLNQLIP